MPHVKCDTFLNNLKQIEKMVTFLSLSRRKIVKSISIGSYHRDGEVITGQTKIHVMPNMSGILARLLQKFQCPSGVNTLLQILHKAGTNFPGTRSLAAMN